MLLSWKNKKIRKAVIPAAGFGTRFLPETKAMPKEMLPIVDKPTIQYIVEEILASGIQKILIISGHAKRAIEDHFDSSPELEQHLEEAGKKICWLRFGRFQTSRSIMYASPTCGDWGMLFSVPKNLSMMNPLVLFLEMM